MTAVRWTLGVLTVLCYVASLFRMQADGVLLLATVLFVAWLWSCGVVSRAFWIADAETSARLGAVDEQVRFIESVRADVVRLEK